MKNIIPKSVIRLIVPIALCLSVWGAIRIVNLVRLNIVKQQVHTIAEKLGATDANTIGQSVGNFEFGSRQMYVFAFLPDKPIIAGTITSVLRQCFDSVLDSSPSFYLGLPSYFGVFIESPLAGKALRIERGDDLPREGGGGNVTFADEWYASFDGDYHEAITIRLEHPWNYHSRFYINGTQLMTDVIVISKYFEVFPLRPLDKLTPLKCS